MRKSRFTETQIIGMLKEQEAGLPACRCRSQDGPAHSPAGLSRDPRGGEGDRREAAPVRLSPDRHSARAQGNDHEPQEALSALPRGGTVGEATARAQAGPWVTHADAGGGASQRPLVARLFGRQLWRLAQVPHSGGDRRLLQGEPVPDRRHQHLGRPCSPRCWMR